MTITSQFKYLTVSEQDKIWGLHLTNVGHILRNKDTNAQKEHPISHTFTWQSGRVLNEYQFIYLVNGQGVFESKRLGTKEINAGDFILLFPGEWHRYKADPTHVWESYFIGAHGLVLENLQQNGLIQPENPVMTIGYSQVVLNLFLEILDLAQVEKTGYQAIGAGMLHQLLAELYTINYRIHHFDSKKESMIQKAKVIFLQHADKNITAEAVARELGVSYSLFRQEFKKFTGFSPSDYFIDLKISKAKAILLHDDTQIKEIAYQLGFSSDQHFCKVFKKKVGTSPGAFREQRMI